ncbi:MAG TPA: stage III sporulation protein AD [Firmicutes bacterium]|nr:stage III sporulation protein AD [Candidatus Fermentithermobacillaceae bacterium]
MNVFQVAVLGLVCSLILALIRRERPEMGVMLSLAAGAFILMLVAPRAVGVMLVFKDMAENAGIGSTYLGVALKVLGIAYVVDFAADLCRDAGEENLASRVELAGKILILVAALPVIEGVFQLILSLLT